MVYFAKWKVVLILAIVGLGFLFAAPNLFDEKATNDFPGFFPHKQVNLGLDLRGGSHLLLEVKVEAVVKERLNSLVDGVRIALRREKIRYKRLGHRGRGVFVTILQADKVDLAKSLLADIEQGFDVAVDGSRISVRPNKEGLREIRDAAVAQSIEIVRRRIDETGTKEPTIQRQGEDRILLQLPGVDDPERVKRLLGRTAKMTFHLLDLDGSIEEAIQGRVPPGSLLLPHLDPYTTSH